MIGLLSFIFIHVIVIGFSIADEYISKRVLGSLIATIFFVFITTLFKFLGLFEYEVINQLLLFLMSVLVYMYIIKVYGDTIESHQNPEKLLLILLCIDAVVFIVNRILIN